MRQVAGVLSDVVVSLFRYESEKRDSCETVNAGGKCKHFSVIKRSREMRNLALSSAGLRHFVEAFVAFSDF